MYVMYVIYGLYVTYVMYADIPFSYVSYVLQRVAACCSVLQTYPPGAELLAAGLDAAAGLPVCFSRYVTAWMPCLIRACACKYRCTRATKQKESCRDRQREAERGDTERESCTLSLSFSRTNTQTITPKSGPVRGMFWMSQNGIF